MGWISKADREKDSVTQQNADCCDIVTAARELSKKLDEIHANPMYQAVWSLANIHGINYMGPTYTDELSNLNRLIKEHDELSRGLV